MLFTEIDDAHVVLCRRGVFQQALVYRRSERLYARVGNNRYIGLRRDRGTTDPKVTWDFIDLDHEFEKVSGAMLVWVVKPEPVPVPTRPKSRKKLLLTMANA